MILKIVNYSATRSSKKKSQNSSTCLLCHHLQRVANSRLFSKYWYISIRFDCKIDYILRWQRIRFSRQSCSVLFHTCIESAARSIIAPWRVELCRCSKLRTVRRSLRTSPGTTCRESLITGWKRTGLSISSLVSELPSVRQHILKLHTSRLSFSCSNILVGFFGVPDTHHPDAEQILLFLGATFFTLFSYW